MATESQILSVEGLEVGYGGIAVVHGIDIVARKGTVVSLLGPNGAGKTTTMKAIGGLLAPSGGSIRFGDMDITGWAASKVVRAGLALVPQGRELFPGLSVMDNLFLGGHTVGDRRALRERIESALSYFPVLADRPSQFAGSLSGGEQQMLAIARGLIVEPAVILLDEPSAGLAPLITRDVLKIVRRICDEREMTALLAEQNATQALRISDYAYVIETGEIVAEGTPKDLKADDRIADLYLGDVGA
jgi:branched-chain amino acid transport system ATP-binding protein